MKTQYQWLPVVVVVMLALLALPVLAETTADATSGAKLPAYEPAKTTVVVMPVVNQTGKQQGKEENEGAQSATDLLTKAFADRGFVVVSAADVAAYIAEHKLDLKDEDSRTKANLLDVGKALKANIVLCGVLQELSSSMHVSFFSTRKVGKAKLQVKAVDVGSEMYLINDVFEGRKKGSTFAPGFEKAKTTRNASISESVENVLGDLLKPYPVVNKPQEKS